MIKNNVLYQINRLAAIHLMEMEECTVQPKASLYYPVYTIGGTSVTSASFTNSDERQLCGHGPGKCFPKGMPPNSVAGWTSIMEAMRQRSFSLYLMVTKDIVFAQWSGPSEGRAEARTAGMAVVVAALNAKGVPDLEAYGQ